jgi:hypothetical protein
VIVRILGVAPRAVEVATGEADERAGASLHRPLSLDGLEDLGVFHSYSPPFWKLHLRQMLPSGEQYFPSPFFNSFRHFMQHNLAVIGRFFQHSEWLQKGQMQYSSSTPSTTRFSRCHGCGQFVVSTP